ncbi:MAG: hypothetical protein IJ019_02135 [Alphaproteobacteria bacterium]|nr:hypothetical protein [Alphaproteobacteria bacterium]
MKIFGYLKLFLGLVSLEEKRKAGESLFEDIVSLLPKSLEETDDKQIEHFKTEILPRYDENQIDYLRAYFNHMIALNRPPYALTGSEERYFSKWENIYRQFLEALSE